MMSDARLRSAARPSTSGGGQPLRILHVLDHSLPLHSGYAFRTIAILREQRRLCWETFHLTGPKQGHVDAAEEEVEGWKFYRTAAPQRSLLRLPMIRHWWLIRALKRRLRELVRTLNPDVIHVHSPALNALPALAVGREFRVPVVYEIRAFWEDAAADHGTSPEGGVRYRLTRALETHVVRRAHAVTTICEGLRQELVERGIEPGKISVIPNAVDPKRFPFMLQAESGLMGKYGLTGGATLGFAGSFYAYEGIDLLLRAIPLVLRAVPDARLLLLGGGPEEPALKALVNLLKLSPNVHFVGRVPHADVQRYYSVMDVMVYPRISRRLTELVTPLKPLEAMALGKLVVASDVGGHRELIRNGETGYLFSAGSVDALAGCLIDVLRTSGARSRMLAAAREHVEQERNWQASVARYQGVYENAMRAGGFAREGAHEL